MLLLVSFCENSFVHRGYGEERHRADLDLGRVDGVEVRQEGQEREADGQQDGCHQDQHPADEDGAEAKVPLKIGKIVDSKGSSFLGSRLLRHLLY